MGLFTWLHKLFARRISGVKNETRIIISESDYAIVELGFDETDKFFAFLLNTLIEKNKMKNYLNVRNFINKYLDESAVFSLDMRIYKFNASEDLKKLAHKFSQLSYKVEYPGLVEYMISLIK